MTNMMKLALIPLILCLSSVPASAGLSQESALSLEASKLAVAGKYQQAIGVYSRLIRIAPQDPDHYIQRGLMYRQIKQQGKGEVDGKVALELANRKIEKRSTGRSGAKNFWRRAMAYRLMHQYDLAKRDMKRAIQLRGDQRWMSDLQAIELEKRIHGGNR